MVLVLILSHLKNKEMVQENTRLMAIITALMIATGIFTSAWAQNTLYEEDFGVPNANTLIGNYTGWQDTTVLYIGNGTCDVRSSSASAGYGGASGGGNVMINDTVKWFQISGLNTLASSPTVNLYCGLRKTSAENGSNFVVEFSTDSLVWVHLPMADTLPTGSGTGGWYRVCFPNLPAHPHLHIRFSNLSKADYRLDDIHITVGEEVVLETVSTPTCTPSGGLYYEGLQVDISCATPGADIYYTFDGTTPTLQSNRYLGTLTVNSNCTLKAFAVKENMYNSNVMSAQYTILDTNALVMLPFDISHNSDSGKVELKTMPGFRSNKLGSSYADGSAKFESKNAGTASLTAHLDGAPGTLSFDLKGVKGGSPSAYSGIIFMVSESADGQQWNTVATLNESDIATDGYAHFGSYNLAESTRYVRWMLAAATSGNTQLNNIVITKHTAGGGDTGVDNLCSGESPMPYPNPAQTTFRWNLCEEGLVIRLYDLSGQLVRQWEDIAPGEALNISDIASGCYMIRATTTTGSITKKLIIR